MDAMEFDRLIKRVSGAADRRRLLAGLLGLVVSGGRGTREATADDTPKANGKRCSKDRQCQSGHCCKSGSAKRGVCRACCDDDACGTSQFCSSGTCEACGGTREPCCPGNTCNRSDLICDVSLGGICQTCGPRFSPCCPGDTCDPLAKCKSHIICVPCGESGLECCDDFICVDSTCEGGVCA